MSITSSFRVMFNFDEAARYVLVGAGVFVFVGLRLKHLGTGSVFESI